MRPNPVEEKPRPKRRRRRRRQMRARGVPGLGRRLRRLRWEWWFWFAPAIACAYFQKWGWFYVFVSLMVLALLFEPPEHSPTFGLDHTFSIESEEFLCTIAGATDTPFSLGNRIDIPITGIGVSREPADQEPLVFKEAQAVVDLIGAGFQVPREKVVSVGGYWQPKYSVPNPGMIEAVQMLAQTEGILLDPVYTGKVMAGLIGLARKGEFADGENVLFLHTGGAPALHAYERVLLNEG